MILVIAEKPSVAQSIAKVLGATSRKDGYMQGDVVSNIFKGVHYELEVKANGYDWMVHTTKYVEVGSHVGIRVIPFNIQVMHKPESSDEKAVEIDV